MTDDFEQRYEERKRQRLRNAKQADLERKNPKYAWMIGQTRYRMRVDSPLKSGARKGTLVYRCAHFDYGCTRADERGTGKPHMNVSINPDGGYPCFVAAYDDLEPAD